MTGEQIVSKVLAGLIGFSIVSMIAVIALLMVCIVGWFVSRWILKRALNRIGVPVSGLIFVPLIGDYHMISKLGLTRAFKFFGITIAAIVPELFVFVNMIGVLFLPAVFKLAFVFVGWFLNGAVYTRVWDLADGKVDGESSLWGLFSAAIPIVFFVKTLIVAFSGKAQSVAEQAPIENQPATPTVELTESPQAQTQVPVQSVAQQSQQQQQVKSAALQTRPQLQQQQSIQQLQQPHPPVVEQPKPPKLQQSQARQQPIKSPQLVAQPQTQHQESIIPQHSVRQPFNPAQPRPADQPRSSVRLQQLQPQVQQQQSVQQSPEDAKPNSIFL